MLLKYYFRFFFLLAVCNEMTGCNKDFLDAKPSSNIIDPKSLSDYEAILESDLIYKSTGALPTLSSDEYYYASYEAWLAAGTATERQSYIWANDVYGGETKIQDWNAPYQAVFYTNNVLDGLNSISDSIGSAEYNFVKGWAYFGRAYAYFDLIRSFAVAYDSVTAESDLGVPLKLKPGVDNVESRATLKKCFEQVFYDCDKAVSLLQIDYPSGHQNHPSKIAAYALLARIHLYMRHYDKAGAYADSAISLYNVLIDYNTLDTTAYFPFSGNNAESIYTTSQVIQYNNTVVAFNIGQRISIDTGLLSLYADNDLRRRVYFRSIGTGQTISNGGYYGVGLYPYSGLSVDEMYLIRAEARARNENYVSAMDDLNILLAKRYVTGTFIPLVAHSGSEALNIILTERRKELVWRGLRWGDLKRLNKEGAGISLTRVLDGQTYTLLPNDSRYVFNIPSDEIALSGIQQNDR